MQKIYNRTNNGIIIGENIKEIYKYLLDKDLFKNEIIHKISERHLTQKDLEILFYSLRFVFNTKEKNGNFYYNLLKPKANQFIQNNFIPGSTQIISEFFKSYNILKKTLIGGIKMGYYICKDCGYLYMIEACTFPMDIFYCINGHKIGGIDHICNKKDIRVFNDKKDYDLLKELWEHKWVDSFEPIMNLQEFKEKYVDKNIPITKKGIIKNYQSHQFENINFVRNMDIITFRLLNFILYSYLMGSYILKSLSKEEVKDYLILGYKPSLFDVIKKNWELLNYSLKIKGIENIQIFMNMIFDDLIVMINNLGLVDSIEKLNAFETDVNKYIMNIISKKEIIEKINNEYKSMNKELNIISPFSLKEIIKSSFDPSLYNQNEYPDIQYYMVSSLQNYESFVNKFKSSKENEKYFLINLLINKNQDITKDALNLKHIVNLNKLGNLLIKIFSYKISREEAKTATLKDKLPEIINLYKKLYNSKSQNEQGIEDFKNEFINPFLKSWEQIKSKAVQYKCMLLKHGNEEGKPLDLNLDNSLSYFLVDIGDKDGGIFLASAYEHLIEWQNRIINIIIEKYKNNGIFNYYIPQLEKKISIQDATENDIININENTYKFLEELIMNTSMRDIFDEEGKIVYKNYNENIYDYEYIETELAKVILTGKKKFRVDDIRFVIYKYEEFKGSNSSILIKYSEKYPKKDLSKEEKNSLKEFLNNNTINNYQDISSSLQIIMNRLIIDNYAPEKSLYEIITNLPHFIILNDEFNNFKNFLANEFYIDNKSFAINTLISIYEYFEKLCWKEMRKHILPDFKLELNEKDKQTFLDYFEKNKNNDKKIINKENFTTALRRLISRFLLSSRQESEIKSENKLSLYIGREELWSKDISNNESFLQEIFHICNNSIKVGYSYNIYEILGGDTILSFELGSNIEEINLNEKKENQNDENEGFENSDSDEDDNEARSLEEI